MNDKATKTAIPIEDLYAAARELTTELLPRLATLIPAKGTILESSMGSHKKHSAAPTPWNDTAAMLYYDIHADARRYENLLTIRLFQSAKYRPGSDAHTTECINRLPILIAHGREQDLDRMDLDDVTHALTNWPISIRRILDESRPGEEKWAKAPGGLRCPYCNDPLAVPPGWDRATNITITCRRCVNDEGQRYTWAPSEWLGLLQEQDADPDELITMETAKRLYPTVRRNTFDVWAWRAATIPGSSPIQIQGHNRKGKPLFRRGDVDTIVQALAS